MATKLRLPPLPTVRDLIKLYRLHALKQLSQNFLLDERITNKIVRAAGGLKLLGAEVCEVGPGPGPITRSILNVGVRKLTVVEKDPRFQPALQLLADAVPNCMDIVEGDILSYNMEHVFSEDLRKDWTDSVPKIHIIGNLPFSVSTPLIIRWLRDISQKQNAWKFGRVGMTLTFQQEVAERIVAKAGDSQRCRLSIMCQNYCNPSFKFTIRGSAFVPKPDVDVGVVTLVPKPRPTIDAPFAVVEKVARNIFSFRQKYCIRGAETLFPVAVRNTLTTELFSRADINPEIRPFQLRLSEIGRLTEIYWDICKREPTLGEYNHRAPMLERGEENWIPENLQLNNNNNPVACL